ncbi:putative F-box protein At1g47790 isoform X1 [Nicotiana tomentosiformis]|uniref:putative F-box protein At1g47790 isoform X1 n=1 Tax=Nicotiana tomentosiformis TaxID=4098 RepID=UPI00051C66EB|nr:putative F-box protein At1g47790 isoform X1 [Nicotiana tomentosiformis]
MRRKSNRQDKKKISVTSDRHGEANREEATQRASLFEQSNREATQKANLFNQISIRDATQKLCLFRCQQKKKKKSVPPNQIRKGKRVVNQSKYTKLMDIDDQDMEIHFQEEIIMDILSKLPVQSLLRFKCVSRFWKKLISEPYFMMKHLNHAKNNQNSQKFLVCQLCPKDGMISFYCSSLSSVQPVEDVQRLDCPSDFKPWRCGIFCCFDGSSLIGVHDYPDIDLICLLWNPSTRESIVLPMQNVQ